MTLWIVDVVETRLAKVRYKVRAATIDEAYSKAEAGNTEEEEDVRDLGVLSRQADEPVAATVDLHWGRE